MVKMMTKAKPNSLYRDHSKAFRYLTVIYKVLHVIFGLDFGFFEVKALKANVILKALTVTYSCAICIFCATGVYLTERVAIVCWHSSFLLEYFLLALILVLKKKKSNVYNVLYDLRTIDSGLKIDPATYGCDWKLLVAIFCVLVHRSVLFALYCTNLDNCVAIVIDRWIIAMVVMAVDVILLTYSFIFYAINCRLKQLAWLLKEERKYFVSKQYLYKSLVDIAEEHKKAFEPMLITTLLFNIPQVMYTIYITLTEIQRNKATNVLLLVGAEFGTALEMMTLMFMPAVCAGMLAPQADTIKVALHEVLIQPIGEAAYEDVQRFIGYVEARPCRLRVCKLIPLDADLISMVLGFCVTYIIVIIQFTNA